MLFLSYLSINVTQESSLGSFTEVELLSESFNCLSWILTGVDFELLGVFAVELNLENANRLFLGLLNVIFLISRILIWIVGVWLHDLGVMSAWSRHTGLLVALSSGTWIGVMRGQLLLASALIQVRASERVVISANSGERSLLAAHPINTCSRLLSRKIRVSSARDWSLVYLRLESQFVSLLLVLNVSGVLSLSSLPSSVLLKASLAHSSLIRHMWLRVIPTIIDLRSIWILTILLLRSQLSVKHPLVLFLSLHLRILVEHVRSILVMSG